MTYLGIASLGQLLLEVSNGMEHRRILSHEVGVRLGESLWLHVFCIDLDVRRIGDRWRSRSH